MTRSFLKSQSPRKKKMLIETFILYLYITKLIQMMFDSILYSGVYFRISYFKGGAVDHCLGRGGHLKY